MKKLPFNKVLKTYFLSSVKGVEDFINFSFSIFDRFPSYIWIMDTKGILRFVNRACLQIYKPFNLSKYIGKSIFSIPEYHGDMEEKIKAVLGKRKDVVPFFIRRNFNNKEKIIEGKIVSVAFKGKMWGVMLIGNDITENYQLMEEAENSYRKYKSIFNYSPEGILFTKLTGEIIAVNPMALNILGYKTREEVIGKNG